MPYNGLKARQDRERLAQAILKAKVTPRETGAPVSGFPVTSGFGDRIHPTLGTKKFHRGVDYGTPTGTPVYATEDGYLSQASVKDPIRGNNVSITAPGYGETRYEHLDRFSPKALKGGAFKKGDLVGFSGSTGRSTGPHLHYGAFDMKGNPVNPLKLQKQTRMAGR